MIPLLSGLVDAVLERAMGIEPTRPAWEAGVLPLNYARTSRIKPDQTCRPYYYSEIQPFRQGVVIFLPQFFRFFSADIVCAAEKNIHMFEKDFCPGGRHARRLVLV